MFVVHLLNWIGGLGWGVGGSFIWREWERAMNMIDNSLYIFEQPNKKRPVLTLVSSRFRNLCKQRRKVELQWMLTVERAWVILCAASILCCSVCLP